MLYIEPYNTYIFTAENIFVGQNLSLPVAGCREFFSRLQERKGGSETRNHCSDALRHVLGFRVGHSFGFKVGYGLGFKVWYVLGLRV